MTSILMKTYTVLLESYQVVSDLKFVFGKRDRKEFKKLYGFNIQGAELKEVVNHIDNYKLSTG